MAQIPQIAICICTFRRPELLSRLLEALGGQETGGKFTFSVIVADNDEAQSAQSTVENSRNRLQFPIVYCVEPCKNIALVRNRALQASTSEFVAFIDDDEFPFGKWLLNLFLTCETHGVSGVLGPVKPYFEQQPPRWLVK